MTYKDIKHNEEVNELLKKGNNDTGPCPKKDLKEKFIGHHLL